jgi:TorA maturation chaperone TorD
MLNLEDNKKMAAMASQRARIYELLVMVFGRVPDSHMIDQLRGAEFQGIIQAFMRAGNKKLKAGAALIDAYISGMVGRNENQIIEELSVDRTMLVRAPGESEFKAPYEGLYKKKKSKGGAPLAVKTFYRRAGLLPDESINESPDYLCLELDFILNLCQREAETWSAGETPADVIRLEHEFLENHLGTWVEDYCKQAEGRARTKFYRGCLDLMKVTVSGDREILNKLMETDQIEGGQG